MGGILDFWRGKRASKHDSAAWQALCDQLCPGDASLYLEVELSINNPMGYLKKFKDALWDRGIEKASEVTPWLALVDGLTSRAHLTELDWRLQAEELAFELENLAPCKERDVRLFALSESSSSTQVLLDEAVQALRRYSLDLLCLDIDSDCYPLAVVPLDRASEVRRLASLVKQRIDI